MKQTLTTIAALLCCLASWAQWTRPAAPAMQPMPTDENVQMYLYNADADAFWLGANDWGTRASVSTTHGWKVSLAKYVLEEGGEWDGQSYKIMSLMENDGWQKGSVMAAKIADWNSIWTDAEDGNTNAKGWTFHPSADGTYRIGLSPADATDLFVDAALCVQAGTNDTRLYIYALDDMAENPEAYHTRWYFVNEADYAAHTAEEIRYNAAMSLAAYLAEAKALHPSVDVSSVEAVYNNMASTTEQLTEARTTLLQLLTAVASPEEAVDVTWKYVTNANYDDNNNTGWSGTAPGFQTHGNAEHYWANYDTYQTVTVPAGVYRASVNAFYRAGWADRDAEAQSALEEGNPAPQNANLYISSSVLAPHATPLPFASTGATDEQLHGETLQNAYGWIPNQMVAAAAYMQAGQYPATSVVGITGADGSLTFGLKKDVVFDGDWTVFDNWKLEYLGNDQAAYAYFKDDYLKGLTDYAEQVEFGLLEYYSHAAMDAYKAAREAMAIATTPEAVVAAIEPLSKATAELEASIAAYAKYTAKVNEIWEYLSEQGSSMGGVEVELLYAYLESEMPGDDRFPNGGAVYIMDNGTLSTEAITKEVEFLQKIFDEALANGMMDGQDCTSLIKNAHFAEAGVWTKEGFPEWPLGTDTYKVAQGYSILFNVSQTVTGLQNGLYELQLNDFFRPAGYDNTDDYNREPKAYVYMNGFEANLNTIESGATEEQAEDGDYELSGVGYVPNSAEAAARAFEAGRYQQTLYGLVTDGTMTIGVRNDLRHENCWAVWSDMKLIFRAKNPEVLASVLESSVPAAEALLRSLCGNEELTALQAAIDAAKGNPEDGYQALIDLKDAMDAVKACTESYRQLAVTIEVADETLFDHQGDNSAEVKALKALYEEVKAAYDALAYNNQEAIDQNAALGAAITAVKMGGVNTNEEQDVTDLIVNNNFDPARGVKGGEIEGWITSPTNGYKEYTCSYNKAAIDLHQTLTGLPAGHYRMTVHTYYRAGYYDEEWARKEAGEETHLTTLYATTPDKTYSTKVMNLYEDAQAEAPDGVKCYTLANGLLAPDGTTPTAAFFAAGYYLNTLEFDVNEDGSSVTIGLKKDEILPNDYEVVGAWNLYYKPAPKMQDVTDLIVNNNFDPARGVKGGEIEGWTTSPTNGYKEYTCSYNKAVIDLHQELKGLPAGHYKVTVHTYYRAGYYDEEWARKEAGEETHLTTLYATTPDKTYSTKVMNLYEDAQAEAPDGVKCYTLANGLLAPDGTTPTAAFFAAGYYLNTLEFDVNGDGSNVTIGLKKDEILPNDYEVVGAWHLYYTPAEAKPEAKDVTDLIVNNNFDPARGVKGGEIEGWVTSPTNGYKEYTCSYNKAAIDLHQTITGLPAGEYKVTVHTYYRAGYYDEEWARKEAGEETHLTTLYATTPDKTFETKVMNLYEDAQAEAPDGVKCYTLANGLLAPDGTTPTAAFFAAGYYLNELDFTVNQNGSSVTIGLKKDEILPNDYEVVGAWHLYYYGKSTAIEGVDEAPASAVAAGFYSLDGKRLDTPQRGINIVKMSDGRVVKILVK